MVRNRREPPPGGECPGEEAVEIAVAIAKRDDALRVAYGWASITTEGGAPVTDRQDEVIETAELRRAVHEFMAEHRTGGLMHATLGVGTVVESLVFSDDVQQALGIDIGREGWWIGIRVDDEAVWRRVLSGELAAFSIGGSAVKVAHDD